MPAIARMGDKVLSPNGAPGPGCPYPMESTILEGNTKNVNIGKIPVAVEGNMVAPHPIPVPGGCGTDQQKVSSFSSTIRIGGKGVARIGDMLGDNIIVEGAPTTFGGG